MTANEFVDLLRAQYDELEKDPRFARFCDHYRLDENHNVVRCSMFDAMMFIAIPANREVKVTRIDEDCWVSTVFLTGLMTLKLPGGRQPRLFETMIFGGPADGHSWKYATWDEAEKHHDVAVKLARTGA